ARRTPVAADRLVLPTPPLPLKSKMRMRPAYADWVHCAKSFRGFSATRKKQKQTRGAETYHKHSTPDGVWPDGHTPARRLSGRANDKVAPASSPAGWPGVAPGFRVVLPARRR